MLVLSRTTGQITDIGTDIEVHVLEIRGQTVRLGFRAPLSTRIERRGASQSPKLVPKTGDDDEAWEEWARKQTQ